MCSCLVQYFTPICSCARASRLSPCPGCCVPSTTSTAPARASSPWTLTGRAWPRARRTRRSPSALFVRQGWSATGVLPNDHDHDHDHGHVLSRLQLSNLNSDLLLPVLPFFDRVSDRLLKIPALSRTCFEMRRLSILDFFVRLCVCVWLYVFFPAH